LVLFVTDDGRRIAVIRLYLRTMRIIIVQKAKTVGCGQNIPLCRKGSGFDAAGLDYLIGKRTQYYDRRQRDRTLMRGDRVVVLGRGIAVVEHADETEVHALLRSRIMLRMRRKDIAWSRQNMRWEAKVSAP
jgi:hypothetical protein